MCFFYCWCPRAVMFSTQVKIMALEESSLKHFWLLMHLVSLQIYIFARVYKLQRFPSSYCIHLIAQILWKKFSSEILVAYIHLFAKKI